MASRDPVSNSGQSHHCPELRIVLIGGKELLGPPYNKSATGNTILGKHVFETNRRTAQSVVRQQEVHGRLLTVVDTPGWWCHYPRENTPKLDQLEIMNSVYLCPPEPNAFLLVIRVGSMFPEIFKKTLQEHLQMFHEKVFNHTIVLFSAEAPCSHRRLNAYIMEWPALQWLLHQCGNRKHVLITKNSLDSIQVTMLLEKIEEMVAENGGSQYYVDRATGKSLGEKMQALKMRARRRFAEVRIQRTKLRAVIEGGKTPPAHLRLVMVGAQWSAKSSAGNTILRKRAFVVDHRTTVFCETRHGLVAERQLTVVDTPGWLYNHTLQDTCEMDKLEIEHGMYLCPPGPHAVLLVVGLSSAFNTSNQRAVKEHMSLFKDEVWNHTIVLFTRGDWLGVKTVEEHIESEEGLQWLVEKCGNRYHVLDNEKRGDEMQVTELLEKVEEMWVGNGDVTVVESPGWLMNTTAVPDWLKGEFVRSVSMCAPGPHAFLLVVPISTTFTKKDREAVVELLMPFGERVWRHCMVLFTWGDWLGDRSIEDHIASEGEALQWLVNKCGDRYHVLNCHRFGEGLPVIELFQKVFDMITRNKGLHFTTEEQQKKQQRSVLPWVPRKYTLTEEQWNRREEQLIDRMLKAVAVEPEEPTLPSVRKTASIDGAYTPSMSGDVPSEVGSTSWSHLRHVKVTEWLRQRAGSTDMTSGVDSMSVSDSYVENAMDAMPPIDDNLRPQSRFVTEIGKRPLDTFHHAAASIERVGTQRRNSC
ncbi:LOW QUALITY PROTEIN: GTPase IMAP family member 8-like [Diretmus argenteus]